MLRLLRINGTRLLYLPKFWFKVRSDQGGNFDQKKMQCHLRVAALAVTVGAVFLSYVHPMLTQSVPAGATAKQRGSTHRVFQGDLNGLEHAPDVFIHTDPTNDFSQISESDVLHQDLRTTVTVKSIERIWIPQPHRQEDDCHEMGERGSEITVLEVIARSDVLGRIDATIVHVPRSNYEFFNEFVVQSGIRFGTLVKVRLGLRDGNVSAMYLRHLPVALLGWLSASARRR